VGFTEEGKILALDVHLFNNGGNSLDLSLPVLERAIFHSENCYQVPNIRVHGWVCYSHKPTNTAFRGFGGPQGMLVTESWIDRVAHEMGKSRAEVQVRRQRSEESRACCV
jgi:xanthine dehydrogenase/oxidase